MDGRYGQIIKGLSDWSVRFSTRELPDSLPQTTDDLSLIPDMAMKRGFAIPIVHPSPPSGQQAVDHALCVLALIQEGHR